MKSGDKRHRPVEFYSFQFIGTSLVGALTIALVSTYAPLDTQVAVLGTFISILAGLIFSYASQEEHRERRREVAFEKLVVPLSLASDKGLFSVYAELCKRLLRISQNTDEILRDLALLRLSQIDMELEKLGRGEIVFPTTESWRTVYERILTSPDIQRYRSVSWVKSPAYWQDQPGRRSTELNIRLRKEGLAIERIAIIRDQLWPVDKERPTTPIAQWLDAQTAAGIEVGILRESELANEPDLKHDFGIYGSRAIGVQEIDANARTERFTLYFDRPTVDLFNVRWQELRLFSRSY
jgi:hypothetical protein